MVVGSGAWIEIREGVKAVLPAWGSVSFAAPAGERGAPMDFKKFYFSPEGRVNRKQWWLWLVLPFTVISILLGFVDMAAGNYHPEAGIGLFSGIFGLLSLIPRDHRPYQALPRP
jgi:hypothetical protein